jgi:hypothetical protein
MLTFILSRHRQAYRGQTLYNISFKLPYLIYNTVKPTGQNIKSIIAIVATSVKKPAIYKGSTCYEAPDRNSGLTTLIPGLTLEAGLLMIKYSGLGWAWPDLHL